MIEKIKELYDNHKLLSSIVIAAGINVSFIGLNNTLFPVRDVISKIYSEDGFGSALTHGYFEGQKDLFQGAMGNAGYELANEKFEEGGGIRKFLYRTSSCAAGGAIFEAFRSGLGFLLTEMMGHTPNYIYNYVVEPRSEAPLEIARSVIFGLIWLYSADQLRK